jgi:hypothetical protein
LAGQDAAPPRGVDHPLRPDLTLRRADGEAHPMGTDRRELDRENGRMYDCE